MADTQFKHRAKEETAVDDVRQVRERLDQESAGDIRKHVEETNRVVEELRQKLGLTILQPSPAQQRRDATSG